MSTLRRRILATAALPAAALGFLLAAPAAASAATTAPQATASVADHEPGHHHSYGLHLSILLGLHITGGHHDDEGDCYDGLLGGGLLDLG